MAGYTRAFNKSTGNVIEASDFNTEFQAIDDAFDETSGHKHDGSAGEGNYVALISDSANKNSVETDDNNHQVDINVNVSGVKTKQIYITDGAVMPNLDSDVDLGSDSVRFKTAYVDTLDAGTVTANTIVGLSDGISSISGLTVPSGNMLYTTGEDTYAYTGITAFARSILDDADENTFKATVNLEIGTDVQAYDANTATTDTAQSWTAEQTFVEVKETVYNLTGTDIDPANGAIQYKSVTGNVTFTSSIASGQSVTLRLVPDAAGYSYTWPSMKWEGGSEPFITDSVDNIIELFNIGGTLYGVYVGAFS